MYKSISVLLIVLLLPYQTASGLTFKSDGSVVQKSGEVVAKSYADRFNDQLSNPDASGWAIANGRSKNPPGYFGNDIFMPGTPLLSVSQIKQGEDYLEALASKNGFSDKQSLQRFIIAYATPKFLRELELEEGQAISFVAAGVLENRNLSEDYLELLEDMEMASLEVASIVQEEVESQVQSQVAEQVEESVEENVSSAVAAAVSSAVDEAVTELVQEAVGQALDQWMIDVIKEREAQGYTDIRWGFDANGEGWVASSCSGDSCP